MAKQLGYEDVLSALVAKAALMVMTPEGPPKMKADSVRIIKLIGGNIMQSTVVNGMLLPRTVEGTITRMENAKITVFGCGIESEHLKRSRQLSECSAISEHSPWAPAARPRCR